MHISNAIKSTIFLATSAVLLVAAFKFMKISKANMAVPAGKYGCVFNVRTSADGALPDGLERTVNSGMIVDFDANTITYSTTRQRKNSGQSDTWTRFPSINQPLSVSTDPDNIPGSWQISFAEQNFSIIARIISVNSGSTYLLQGINLGTTGVCQKV